MKMTLNYEEINEAIVNWVAKQGIDLTGKETEIEFTAGRKENGNSAIIDIKPMNHELPDNPHVNVQVKELVWNNIEISVEPQDVGDVTEVEPTIPDDTPVLNASF
jgi:hypothetical protein